MHIAFGEEKHLKEQPFIYKKKPLSGLLLIRKEGPVFRGHYYINGYRQWQLPKVIDNLDLDSLVVDEDLEMDDIDNPYLMNERYNGSSFREFKNQVKELATYSGDDMPLFVIYDLRGEISHLEKTIEDVDIEIDFEESLLKSIKLIDINNRFKLSIRYEQKKISSISFSGVFDEVIFKKINAINEDYFGNKYDFFSIGNNIELNFGAVIPEVLALIENQEINQLSLYSTELELASFLDLISKLKPSKLVLEEDSIIASDKDKALEALSVMPGLEVEKDLHF